MEHIRNTSGDPGREISPRNNPEAPAPVRLQVVESPESEFNDEEDSSGLLEYWEILRRRKGAILLISFLGALGGLLLSLPQTPVYQARCSLEIQGFNENFLNMANVNPTTTGVSVFPEYDIQTQVKILESRSLIERAAAKLKLQERPEVASPPGHLGAWRKALGLPLPDAASLQERALATAMGNVKVRASGQNRIVEILSDSTDPRFAADFANTLANEFIEQNLEARWNTTQRTGEWLTRQMQDVRINLEKSEDQLQAYARASGLMFTSDKENVVEEKLRQLQQELSKAQADRIAKQSQYEISVSSAPDALPEVLDSEALHDYQAKITDLRRQLAELGSSLTPAHPKVKRLEAQIATLESSLNKERSNIASRIRNEYSSALRREKLLAADYANQAKLVSEQAASSIHYNILKREVDTNRQLYDTMLQKMKEASITSAMRASNVRLVDSARPPGGPYKPNLPLNSAIGLLAGVFLGMVFVLLGERADRTLRSPGDASFYVKVPELGAIPSIRADAPMGAYGRRELVVARKKGAVVLTLRSSSTPNDPAADGAEGRAASSNGSGDRVEMVTWHHKPSLLAESFRAALTSILFSGQNGNRPRVIVFTSPAPSEGKTTVACNLGIALAEINHRVLLIDADMRRPRLHDVFHVDNSRGLSDLLREKNSIQETPREAWVRETEVPGLFLLPSGPEAVSISNLLYSARVPELLNRARREFDTVLIDTPPMLQIADARVLGRLADAVILVLRAGRTTRDTALAATQRFAEDGTPVLGTILNSWNPISNGGHYGYGDYTGYYKGRYGNGSKG